MLKHYKIQTLVPQLQTCTTVSSCHISLNNLDSFFDFKHFNFHYFIVSYITAGLTEDTFDETCTHPHKCRK